MCMTKTHTRITWIVIRTKICMTNTNKSKDRHSFKAVYDENPYKNNMDSHSYRDVHDETHRRII